MTFLRIPFVLALLLLGCCVTNGFKVVDALRIGMSQEEAKSTISSLGFEREQVLERPSGGWPESDDTFTRLAGRARNVENVKEVTVAAAEYYSVGHGMFGFEELFLFYDDDGKLIDYYRRQIN
jgi:hypothetical protein